MKVKSTMMDEGLLMISIRCHGCGDHLRITSNLTAKCGREEGERDADERSIPLAFALLRWLVSI